MKIYLFQNFLNLHFLQYFNMELENSDKKNKLSSQNFAQKSSEIKTQAKSSIGKVVQFRRGRKTIHEKHYILDVGSKNREEASKFIGKTVIWTSPAGKKLSGKISSAHGNKGLVRSIFNIGLPGQARNTEVEIQ